MYPTMRLTDAHVAKIAQRSKTTIALASPTNKGADLSQWCGSVFNQYDEGSCTAATTRDYLLWRQNRYGWKNLIEPSVQELYYWGRSIFGDLNQDAGSTVHDAFQASVQYGVIPADKELYTNADIYQLPPMQYLAFKATNVQDYAPTTANLRSLAESGVPCGIAVNVQQTIFNPIKYDGISVVDVGTIVPNAGHAIFYVGYKPDPKYQFLYKCQGSWGTEYGDNGFFWFTEAYLQQCLQEICTLDIPQTEPVQPTPTPQPPAPKPKPHPQPKPQPSYYELTVGPADVDTVSKIESYCLSLHVGVVRKQVH